MGAEQKMLGTSAGAEMKRVAAALVFLAVVPLAGQSPYPPRLDSGKRFEVGKMYKGPYADVVKAIAAVPNSEGRLFVVVEILSGSTRASAPDGIYLHPADTDCMPACLDEIVPVQAPAAGVITVPASAYDDPIAFLTSVLTRTDLSADQLERVNDAIRFERGVLGTERSGLSLRNLR
jgi:hypothetical protein